MLASEIALEGDLRKFPFKNLGGTRSILFAESSLSEKQDFGFDCRLLLTSDS